MVVMSQLVTCYSLPYSYLQERRCSRQSCSRVRRRTQRTSRSPEVTHSMETLPQCPRPSTKIVDEARSSAAPRTQNSMKTGIHTSLIPRSTCMFHIATRGPAKFSHVHGVYSRRVNFCIVVVWQLMKTANLHFWYQLFRVIYTTD